ncbi:hypothetical protein K466DRAFT_179002 [Polyporus arcularius HHB13444]|uniref:Uncharacterized protein n=1 Tax=Polyporus arcularius HHB13444 TaxID=1314778 RepID=A0A5C3P8A7_9APHY|nr:hypothetical protein K466DRAFT_179002 [Polyporus arcularius HHB13444]
MCRPDGSQRLPVLLLMLTAFCYTLRLIKSLRHRSRRAVNMQTNRSILHHSLRPVILECMPSASSSHGLFASTNSRRPLRRHLIIRSRRRRAPSQSARRGLWPRCALLGLRGSLLTPRGYAMGILDNEWSRFARIVPDLKYLTAVSEVSISSVCQARRHASPQRLAVAACVLQSSGSAAPARVYVELVYRSQLTERAMFRYQGKDTEV